MEDNKIMKVSAIENGTVIDHIPPRALFQVIDLLGLEYVATPVTFATNLKSVRMGSKAIVKITDVYCSDEQISYLALVAPTAKISIIKNYEVVEKRQVVAPKEVHGFVRCANPMCITNHEKIRTHFSVSTINGELSLCCQYCEKSTRQEQFEIIR
ncbi:MAG: aspartate carbamoyltransferase regulatory subunit [Mucinivorans sp.]